jgi:predicted RNase H-like HicB family nuclease
MSYDYEIILSHSSEEDGEYWVATVPDLPGCMSDGTTPNKAINNVQEAIEAWIEHAKAIGRDVPEPKYYSGKFTVRLPKSLHKELELRAKNDNVSLNQTVVHLLSYALGKTSIVQVKVLGSEKQEQKIQSDLSTLFQNWVDLQQWKNSSVKMMVVATPMMNSRNDIESNQLGYQFSKEISRFGTYSI